jgi:hypothetical protein
MVSGVWPIVTAWPIASAREPSSRCQKLWLTTTTGALPGRSYC